MTISNYPNGFANGVTIRGIPLHQTHPGEVFWVNNSSVLASGGSAGSDSGKGDYLRPFATIDYAIGKCTAARGDIIAVMPGHAESITAASGITSDVAGVAIVGLGAGSSRPQITFTATDSTWVFSAANNSLSNIQLVAGIAEVVTGLSLTGAADGFTMEDCHTSEGTGFNYVDVITLATGADDLSWKNCTFIGGDANNDAFITGVAHSGFYLDNCRFYSNVAQATATGLVDASGNVTNIEIKDCSFRSNVDGALWIDFNGTACGGIIKHCMVSSLDTADAVTTGDATGAHFFECYVSGEEGKFGLIGGESTVYVNA